MSPTLTDEQIAATANRLRLAKITVCRANYPLLGTRPLDQINADIAAAADLIEAQAAELAALRAERDALPRLTQGMIEAACIAHYGKKLAGLVGGASGVSMTADGIDHNFTAAFRRMWSGVRSHMRALKGGA